MVMRKIAKKKVATGYETEREREKGVDLMYVNEGRRVIIVLFHSPLHPSLSHAKCVHVKCEKNIKFSVPSSDQISTFHDNNYLLKLE